MSPLDPARWEEIHRRVETARAALTKPLVLSPEEETDVLKTRARELGQESEMAVATEDVLSVVEFELAGERYAFPLAAVREVIHLRELTLVPCTPAFIRGIINLRGDVRIVIDLKTFFRLPDAGLTELNKVLLVQHGEVQLGVLADAVHGVLQLQVKELQPAPPTLAGVGADYVRGVTRDDLIVLSPELILADKRLLVDDDTSA